MLPMQIHPQNPTNRLIRQQTLQYLLLSLRLRFRKNRLQTMR